MQLQRVVTATNELSIDKHSWHLSTFKTTFTVQSEHTCSDVADCIITNNDAKCQKTFIFRSGNILMYQSQFDTYVHQ